LSGDEQIEKTTFVPPRQITIDYIGRASKGLKLDKELIGSKFSIIDFVSLGQLSMD
jgi:hypothetical protein